MMQRLQGGNWSGVFNLLKFDHTPKKKKKKLKTMLWAVGHHSK